MTKTFYEIEEGELYGAIDQQKYSPLFEVIITYYDKTVYHNYFDSKEKAKKALKRNWKKNGGEKL